MGSHLCLSPPIDEQFNSIFIDDFTAGVDRLHIYFDKVIVAGDLNYDFNIPQKSQPLQSVCDIFDFTNLITKPTCFTKNAPPSIVDVILTNIPSFVFNIINISCGISDWHNIISVVIKGHAPPPKHHKIKYCSYKQFDEEAFSEAVGVIPFQAAYLFYDVDDIYWPHEVLFTDILNEHAPVKEKYVKTKVYPFINTKLRKACGNYRTIALISHASKVLLRVIHGRLEVFLIPELPIEQAGFRRGRGTRDHIANLRWMMEKAMEHQRDLYLCFIDYKKAFYCVDHEILWVILRDMRVPVHLIVLLKRLYTNQEATVRTEFGETDNIDIGKGVRQGCILSPLLFNIYAENIMREALEEWVSGISVGGRIVTNLRYADDTTLIAETKEDLTELVERVRRASEKAGLYLNRYSPGKQRKFTTNITRNSVRTYFDERCAGGPKSKDVWPTVKHFLSNKGNFKDPIC